MSEKRFRANFDVSIYDSETEEYISVSERGLEEIAKRMNEQQATISALKEENDILKQKLRKNYIANKQYEEMKRLQEENEQLKEKLQSVTMLKDDYEELIESFEKKYGKNIEDVIDDV